MTEEIKTESTLEKINNASQGADKEKDNSAESSTVEETNTNSTGSSDQDKDKTQTDKKEGDAGFADDPRWQERENDWKKRFNDQEIRHADDIKKAIEATESKFTKKREDLADQDEPPAWFGGDKEAWKQYKAHEDARLAQAEENAIKRLERKAEEQQKATEEATKYFNEEVSKIEADKTINPSGEKVDRNKLLKFTFDNDIINSAGKWNYRAAYLAMKSAGVSTEKKNDANLDERRRIAGATTSDHRGEHKSSDVSTSEDFKGKNWGNI